MKITTPCEYVQAAMRTKSPHFNPERATRNEMRSLLADAVSVGEQSKIIKKAIFGGKEREPSGYKLRLAECPSPDILHAILGVLNEAGEIANAVSDDDAYLKVRNTIDYNNLDEEMGDLLWFIACYCEGRGCLMEQLMERNIAKLKARFPDRFDSDKNENRDVQAEKRAMGGGDETYNPAS